MPWELGYFDGGNGNVAILPVVAVAGEDTFTGLEYLGLYPYVDFAQATGAQRTEVFVNRNSDDYRVFRAWKNEADKLRPVA
jgi:hypothetical protein